MVISKEKLKNTISKIRKGRRKRLVLNFALIIFLSGMVFASLMLLRPASGAAACPVTDGGAGDGDASVNGILTISANTTWSAPGSPNNGEVDCTGVDILVEAGVTLTLDVYEDGDEVYDDDYIYILNTDAFEVEDTGIINSNGLGYPRKGAVEGYGPGGGGYCTGDFQAGQGGSYGGRGSGGCINVGDVVGNPNAPTIIGSGGGRGDDTADIGGPGGGGFKIATTGDIVVDGTMRANGSDGVVHGSGGSGGTIWLLTTGGTISGGGDIQANGADRGGGGRVLIEHPNSLTYTGTYSATGNTGGGNGSVVLKDATNSHAYYIADNRWLPEDATTFETWFTDINDLTIQNNSTITLDSLNKTSASGGIGWTLDLTNFTLESGSAITMTGKGYQGATTCVAGYGPGGGGSTCADAQGGGGGAHCGAGANGSGASGGSTYDTASSPTDLGSGGGKGDDTTDPGGHGGGALKITTSNDMDISGDITTNGTDGNITDGAAGAGGSIWLIANGTLSGGGDMTANGGDGAGTRAGAGGGGCISYEYANSTYSGTPTVAGGTYPSGRQGSAGSITSSGYPATPTNVKQYHSNSTAVIETGETTKDPIVVMKMTMSDASVSDTLTPEVEIKEVGTGFSDTATATGEGVAYTGTPVTGSVTSTGLTIGSVYHWQTRVCDAGSDCTDWVAYGGNAESATDFEVNTDPVFHLNFDEGYGSNTYDRVATGSGSISGASWTNSGRVNKALSFDGTDDYVQVDTNSVINLNNQDGYSVCGWIYPDTDGELDNGEWFSKGDSYIRVDNESGSTVKVSASFDLASNDASTTIFDTIPTGAWSHVCVTYADDSDDEITIFINGVKKAVSSNGDGSPADDSASNLFIGGDSSNNFDGLIDEVTIYSSPISAFKVRVDMNYLSSASYSVLGDSEAADLLDGEGNPPVAEWNFDENDGQYTNDTSGNGNQGTLGANASEASDDPKWVSVKKAPEFSHGLSGSALEFDGSDDDVQIPDPAGGELDFGTGDFSVMGWVNTTSSINDTGLFGKGIWGGGRVNAYGITLRNNGVARLETSTTSTQSSTLTINDGNWHHVAGVRNSGELIIYIDGKSDGNSSPTLVDVSNGLKFRIGARYDSTNNLDGAIDDVRVYDYARTPAQVAYDYNRGKPVGWWKFDKCSGAVAFDHSGNGNNGTITASTGNNVGTCGGTAGDMWADGETGKFNASLAFDGTDDWVDVGYHSELDITGDVSLSGWIKPSDSYTYAYGYFLRNGIGTDLVYAMNYHHSSQTVGFGWYDGSFKGVATAEIFPYDQWNHATAVREGNTITIYKNGVLVTSSEDGTTPIGGASPDLSLGRGNSSQNLSGQLDDLRIYNYALSANQIKKVMNEGAVRFGPAEGSP